ncbi:nmrA-like family protein [Cavenderia fasciculata]|uniref:NmrA-like family protein n=1 Tax=Cavenderia fasciculata TaxID=261658 RepID=F4PIG4_CACFS|nr:nmrA-like family protein [Cavenderia fasciculata]EGG25393.1 nmrA-like family protein [Cavenderia fasciculata]|eukprot:XP_004363244.1 nmrA-like family protein [Cavenderia fasciculata]
MSCNKIFVCGASGNVGLNLMKSLEKKGSMIKAGVRDPSKFKCNLKNVEPVKFDYKDKSTWDMALKGCDKIFMIALPMDMTPESYLGPLIEKCKEMKFKKIVFLSVVNPEKLQLFNVENLIKNCGINYGILRPPFFMDNFSSGFMRQEVDKGCISSPAGQHAISFISCKDIGDCACEMLITDKHNNQIIEITGPAPLTFTQISQMLEKQLNKSVKYNLVSESDFFNGAKKSGMPSSMVKFYELLYEPIMMDKNAKVTKGVEQITGHKPMSFECFLKEGNFNKPVGPSM